MKNPKIIYCSDFRGKYERFTINYENLKRSYFNISEENNFLDNYVGFENITHNWIINR